MSLKSKKKVKKLVSVLATSMLMIATRERAVETAKTIEAAETARAR